MKRRRAVKTVKDAEWTEATVAEAIRVTRYQNSAAWVFLRNVPDGTSSDKRRTADAIAVGCWRSEGMTCDGYEIKVSRADWQKELQDRAKSLAFANYCHLWYIAAPEGIVKAEEMPAEWGLIVVTKRDDGSYSSRVKKAAAFNQNVVLDYKFFAAALRKCLKSEWDNEDLQEKLRAEYLRGTSDGERWAKNASNDSRFDVILKKYEKLQKDVQAFESAAGFKIQQWGHSPPEIGDAVRHVLDHDRQLLPNFEHVIRFCDGLKTTIQQFVSASQIQLEKPPIRTESLDAVDE